MTFDKDATALGPYKALDLTEGGYNWCGKVLADLGADVIKVEPPGGSPTRYHWPLDPGQEEPDRSWFWESYCFNKRGITLDIRKQEGVKLLKRLASDVDFLIISSGQKYMDSLGLGYEELSKVNPRLVMASMTPFGESGPYSGYKATDLVSWAMGGMAYISGDSDRAPVRITFPQAELHAGAQAVVGSMCAFWKARNSGEGQVVEVSTQVAVYWTMMNAGQFPQLEGYNVERNGPYTNYGGPNVLAIFPCKDGYVSFTLAGGNHAFRMEGLVRLMEEEGFAPEFMKNKDWVSWGGWIEDETAGPPWTKEQEEIDAVSEHIRRFFMTKTREELFDLSIREKVLLAPCNAADDVMGDVQLKARGYWLKSDTPGHDQPLRYAGRYISMPECPISFRRRAPGVGEHNREVFIDELGIGEPEFESLRKSGVI